MTMAKSATKPTESKRGSNIGDNFCKNFKKSKFYEVYKNHKDELFIGVRDGYINIYYNCASIAKIDAQNDCEVIGVLSAAYINQKGDVYLTDKGFEKNYEMIKSLVDKKEKSDYEKTSQERLVIDNNNNPSSDWYCLDVEYTRTKDKKEKKGWRFDIIAISKSAPHRIALIELKYGDGSIDGDSGVQAHLDAFSKFSKDNLYDKFLKEEIISIIKKQDELGVIIPDSIKSIGVSKLADAPEFYFITLNNNKKSPKGSTPKMSMGGYLFTDKNRWGTKRLSTTDVAKYEKMVFDLKPTFLFSTAIVDKNGRLTKPINDILDEKCYDDVDKI